MLSTCPATGAQSNTLVVARLPLWPHLPASIAPPGAPQPTRAPFSPASPHHQHAAPSLTPKTLHFLGCLFGSLPSLCLQSASLCLLLKAPFHQQDRDLLSMDENLPGIVRAERHFQCSSGDACHLVFLSGSHHGFKHQQPLFTPRCHTVARAPWISHKICLLRDSLSAISIILYIPRWWEVATARRSPDLPLDLGVGL